MFKRSWRRAIGALALMVSFALLSLAIGRQPTAIEAARGDSQPRADIPGECLECHGDPDLSLTLPSGEELSLHIPEQALEGSIHEQLGISCDSCHQNITGYPHPEIDYQTRRELSRSLYLSCELCHSNKYEETLDSIHAEIAEAGRLEAPVCTDCHGAHDIQDPDAPRSKVSLTCGQCHEQIAAEYRDSVHGAALIDLDNPDVPVCTDCHGVHNIQDPRTAQFRIASPEMCAHCHDDPRIMEKYNLTDVYDIYSLSWHGVDVSVYKANWPNIWHESAVCTDCHGVHGIYPASDPKSKVNPENLLTTCQECHPDAGPNWTGAWTGHQEISLARTPLVFYTQAFYESFVPFVLIASAAYVLLRIIRATVDRVRRNLP
ncbi:MAG: cytochrome c3 family protein [Anaerolineales bacterium]